VSRFIPVCRRNGRRRRRAGLRVRERMAALRAAVRGTVGVTRVAHVRLRTWTPSTQRGARGVDDWANTGPANSAQVTRTPRRMGAFQGVVGLVGAGRRAILSGRCRRRTSRSCARPMHRRLPGGPTVTASHIAAIAAARLDPGTGNGRRGRRVSLGPRKGRTRWVSDSRLWSARLRLA
jgi:hypothetical protein